MRTYHSLRTPASREPEVRGPVAKRSLRFLKLTGTIITAAVTLSGCVSSTNTVSESTTSPPVASAPTSSQVASDHEEPFTGTPAWDDEAREQALTAAANTMNAFAQSHLSQTEWWTQLSTHLSPSAARAYSSVRVENVPVATITGTPQLIDDSSPYTATYDVSTNAGIYQVRLSRLAAGAPWLAERIIPPEGRS